MRFQFIAAAAFLAALTFASLAAAESAADAYVRDVLARNPSLRAGASRRDAFHEEAAATGTWPDPVASLMLDQVPRQGMDGEMPMVRYQLSQMVMWPGKRGLMRSAVEREADAATADLETKRRDLTLAARRGYAMLRLNAKRREIDRAGRSLAATIAAAALGRYGTGVGGHHDVARAQVEVDAFDVELLTLEGERAATVAMLNALRDEPPDAPLADPAPGDDLPRGDLALASLVERAKSDRPELLSMRAMQREAQAMASLARKEPYPDLMGSVWYNQMIGAPNTFGVMVGGTIPLFGVARAGHRAASFDARAEGAASDQQAMWAMIRAEVAGALVRVQTATRQLELVEKVALPRARESFETALAGYGASTLDIVGVLDARRALQASQLARAEAQVDTEVALAELEHAVGGPLQGTTP